MALLTLAEVKAYLKVETNADDAVLTRLLTGATALVAFHLRRPLTAAAPTVPATETWVGVSSARGPGSDYSVEVNFASPLALDQLPGYATGIEPILNDVLMDLVSDRWHRRNPAVSSEGSGGASVSYDTSTALPKRAVELLRAWRA
jgi:hypothetical protein